MPSLLGVPGEEQQGPIAELSEVLGGGHKAILRVCLRFHCSWIERPIFVQWSSPVSRSGCGVREPGMHRLGR